MSENQEPLENEQVNTGCQHDQQTKCHNCQKCDELKGEFLKMISQLFININLSGNSQIISKVENEQNNIAKSILSASNEVLLIQTNSEAIYYKLESLLDFSKNKNKMESLLSMNMKKIFNNAPKLKEQQNFTASIKRFHKFMKRLSQQDTSQSEFNSFEDKDEKEATMIKQANFSFFFESLQLNQNDIVQIFQSLVFMEVDIYTEIYNHVITSKKFLRKAPELKDINILKDFDKILAITVQKNERIVILQTIFPQIVGFSPKFANTEKNDQAVYLNKGMKLKLSKNYEIRVIEVSSKNVITKIPENLIVKLDEKTQPQAFSKSVVDGTNSYITIQEWIDNVGFTPLTIYQQKQDHGSIALNHLLDLPNNVQIDVSFDQNGFYFSTQSEQPGFYPSLHFDGQLMCITKEINLVLVINNELRVHLSSDGGELFDDSEEKSRQIV